MHTMHEDKCVDVSTDAGYGGLSKMSWGKQVCVTKQGRGGQWLLQDEIQNLLNIWQKWIEVEADYMEKW